MFFYETQIYYYITEFTTRFYRATRIRSVSSSPTEQNANFVNVLVPSKSLNFSAKLKEIIMNVRGLSGLIGKTKGIVDYLKTLLRI